MNKKLFKFVFLNILLMFNYCVYCQETTYSLVNDSTNESTEELQTYLYPNTDIGKFSFVLHGSLGHMPYSRSLTNYFKNSIIGGGTMSLDLFFENKFAFSLCLMGTDGNLKQDIAVGKNQKWKPGDTITFESYGILSGYSFLSTLRWRFTTWGGVVLSQSRLISSDNTEKLKIGPRLSPIIGINFSYRFINPEKYKSTYGGTAACGGINFRVSYVPLAVHKKGIPFSGGVWYLTIGVNLEMFQTYSRMWTSTSVPTTQQTKR
ncbi:MAG: hypothetical protein LBU91_08300 [Bacteroidales bacterium]|nr:hypothetical protein [Bacteroidales bacterium]